MIPNHEQFLAAIHERKKVNVRFYSMPDSGVVDRVCAPLDYGPDANLGDGLNRYWFWDYAGNAGPSSQGLVPEQIVDVRVLGEDFDPYGLGCQITAWSIPREWPSLPQPTDTPSAPE